ncbi:hypothetical protein X975_22525, partial [Stegodyphus mimosarum]
MTFSCNFRDWETFFVGHITQISKNHEATVKTGETVYCHSEETISVTVIVKVVVRCIC